MYILTVSVCSLVQNGVIAYSVASTGARGLRGRVVKAICFETTRTSHQRSLSVANRSLLVHSQEQPVPPAVETDRHLHVHV